MVALRHPRNTTVRGGEPNLADVLYEALELVAWTMRYEMPDLFERVDEIKARPNREPQEIGTFEYGGQIAECAWCGDDFPLSGDNKIRTCCPECSDAWRVWKTQRRRAARRVA